MTHSMLIAEPDREFTSPSIRDSDAPPDGVDAQTGLVTDAANPLHALRGFLEYMDRENLSVVPSLIAEEWVGYRQRLEQGAANVRNQHRQAVQRFGIAQMHQAKQAYDGYVAEMQQVRTGIEAVLAAGQEAISQQFPEIRERIETLLDRMQADCFPTTLAAAPTSGTDEITFF